MRSVDIAIRQVRPALAALRRVMGLGAALALALPVAALVQFDAGAGGLGWALRPASLPGGDWPGSWSPAAVTAAAQQAGALGDALGLLLALAMLVWLAALADLVLGSLRSVARDRHDWAVRSAVGAKRRQLRREVAVRQLRFAGLAGGLGLGGAALVCARLPAILPSSLDLAGPGGPAMLAASPIAALVVAGTAAATVGFPLLLMPRPGELRRPAAHVGGRLDWVGGAAWWLAAGQIGACVAIVVCAAFLVRAAPDPASSAKDTYPYARDTLVLRVRLPGEGPRAERWRAVRDAAAGLPGVSVASVSSPGAWLGLGTVDRVGAECPGCSGGGLGAPITVGLARHLSVDDEYFRLLGLEPEAPAADVRDGSAGDPSVPAVVIDETFRDRLFQGRPALNSRVWLRGSLPLAEPGAVIGRVASAPERAGLTTRRHAVPTVYASLSRYPPLVADLAVRFDASPGQIPDLDPAAGGRATAAAVRSAVPGAQVVALGRLADLVDARAAAVRRLGRATLFLAGAAFLLALFGASAAAVERVRERTREIGLRRALGARRGAVIGLVVGDAARLVGAGVLAGLAMGTSVNRGLPVLVDSIAPLPGAAVVGLALLVATLGVAASLAAARRAAGLDPVAALRE